MRRIRRTTPPDRRAARLVMVTSLTPDRHAAEAGDPVRGLDALDYVLAVYGPERLVGRGNAREADRALRAAARVLAAEARVEDPARAECLLVALKQSWPTLPAVARMADVDARRALWDRVVALCIQEFYAPARVGVPAA